MNNLKLPDISDVPDSQMEARYLIFRSDNQLYGVSIASIVQIVGIQEITRLPDFPAYMKGVISLRGEVLPVIDMRLRMGMPEAIYTERVCIIIAKIEETPVGFIADEVEEVLNIPRGQISPPPQLSGDSVNDYLAGIGQLERGEAQKEEIVLILDLSKLLGDHEISALRSLRGQDN